MTSPEPRAPRRRLGEVLVGQGLLTPEQLDHVLAAQSDIPAGRNRKRLGQVVIELGLASEHELARALAEALALPLVDLGQVTLVAERVRLIPRAVAERHGVVVLDMSDGRVTVAMSDPTNVIALDDVRLLTRAHEVSVTVAAASQVAEQLQQAWGGNPDGLRVESLMDALDAMEEEEDAAGQQAVAAAPIVRLVEELLGDAVRAGASDIHCEPHAGGLRVRQRVDGLLREVMSVPSGARAAVVSRIKILSGLDIAERRRPQDGRARLTLTNGVVEARVSTMPTLHGEKVVVRLMPNPDKVPALSDTGLTRSQLDRLSSTLAQTQGLVLITGPTGSGKTSTLYAAINHLSRPDRNVVTIEDPVEMQLPGVTQVHVHERAGLTFARGLRSILRQDPDVVMVGEVRDPETAELALQASLTGHLVLTTLHTNDAVSAVTRLVDMGVEPYLVATSLSLVVAQRLIRKPCAACAVPYEPSATTLARLGLTAADLASATPRQGQGCAVCGGTGYQGRTGVFEILHVNGELRQALLSSPSTEGISAAARRHGIMTLRASALAAAHLGETTYEEVLRVTHVEESGAPTCPSCARALADDMTCCPWDGTPVGRDHCHHCDRAVDADWTTCPWCRTAVHQIGSAIPAQRTAEQEPREIPARA